MHCLWECLLFQPFGETVWIYFPKNFNLIKDSIFFIYIYPTSAGRTSGQALYSNLFSRHGDGPIPNKDCCSSGSHSLQVVEGFADLFHLSIFGLFPVASLIPNPFPLSPWVWGVRNYLHHMKQQFYYLAFTSRPKSLERDDKIGCGG